MVVTSHEYLPFGEDWITEGDTKNAPKYNSQELDKESGYYFYNARHYDPEIHRFVTADSIVPRENDTQSWSRYSYCSNSPVIYKDPTGHYEIKVEVSKNRDHAGTLTLYNDYGIKVASYTALARGSNAPENNYNHTNRLKQNADTPTGKYVVTDKIKIPDKNSSDYHTYGPNRLRLSGVEGEAKKAYDNGRSGINIHGGDQRTAPRPGTDKNESGRNLNYTYGCVRVSNEAISDLSSKVNKIEEGRKEGVTQYLYKARNYLYNIIGKDTRDVVNVTEKK